MPSIYRYISCQDSNVTVAEQTHLNIIVAYTVYIAQEVMNMPYTRYIPGIY
jgi:hypothetical protein